MLTDENHQEKHQEREDLFNPTCKLLHIIPLGISLIDVVGGGVIIRAEVDIWTGINRQWINSIIVIDSMDPVDTIVFIATIKTVVIIDAIDTNIVIDVIDSIDAIVISVVALFKRSYSRVLCLSYSWNINRNSKLYLCD